MKKIVLLLTLCVHAFLSAMERGKSHHHSHIINRAIVTKIIKKNSSEWNIVAPAARYSTSWRYDQRILLWDYNKASALATCPKTAGQTDTIRECYHFYPLAIEALYLDHAITGHVPFEHNEYHEEDRCYYFPGFIEFCDENGHKQRIDGFFESTFNKDGSILYHRCFHQALENAKERRWGYPKEVRQAEAALHKNWKNYCYADHRGEINREEHNKTVDIYIPIYLQYTGKERASNVIKTYDICEVVTDSPEYPIPCVEFVDQSMPEVVYGIFTSTQQQEKVEKNNK